MYIEGSFSQALVQRDTWLEMNDCQKMKRIIKILKSYKNRQSQEEEMLSSDGKLKLKRIPSFAKKPNQRSRSKSTKTTSFKRD